MKIPSNTQLTYRLNFVKEHGMVRGLERWSLNRVLKPKEGEDMIRKRLPEVVMEIREILVLAGSKVCRLEETFLFREMGFMDKWSAKNK